MQALRGVRGMRAQQHAVCNARSARSMRRCVVAASTNGTSAPAKPTPAETARTLIDICQEGTLCTLAADGTPIGTPVAFNLDKKTGRPLVELAPGSLESHNLSRNQRCSLMVQHTQFPARAVASVTLVGTLDPSANDAGSSVLNVDHALYFGGLDQSAPGVQVSAQELLEAEPDVLRTAAVELIRSWNDEAAEDIYRIVSDHLKVPLTEMSYAELLWLDRLGMYVRVEVDGQDGHAVVRVPFYRPVLDERDARSVLTMAAQVAWERERPYVPPVPAIFADPAAAVNN